VEQVEVEGHHRQEEVEDLKNLSSLEEPLEVVVEDRCWKVLEAQEDGGVHLTLVVVEQEQVVKVEQVDVL